MEKEQEKVDSLRAKIAAKESETNTMEERLNQTKPLDALKEQESELQHQNEEDQVIIQDENASPSEKEAAEDRVAERNEEIVRLQTQITERERGRPLLERVKDIFKKHGVTLTAILIAAGTTIGAVIGVLTRGLKTHRQSFGKWPQRYCRETWFSAARDDWLNCELAVQSRRPSRRISGRAYLAAYSCRGGLFVRRIF